MPASGFEESYGYYSNGLYGSPLPPAVCFGEC